jgi:hypothetical protein
MQHNLTIIWPQVAAKRFLQNQIWWPLKGSVQRKLRWVENNVNRSVGALECGARHSSVILFGFHLDFTIFLFPVSTAQVTYRQVLEK